MASLIRRIRSGKLTWYVRYYPVPGGRPREVSTGTGNKREAGEIKLKIEENLRRHKWGITRPLPVSEIFDRRLEFMTANNYAEDTIYRCALVRRYFLGFLKNDPSGTPTPHVFEGYKAYRQGQGINPTTLNIELGALKSTFNWGFRFGYCEKPEITKVREIESKIPPYLTEDEVDRILKAAGDTDFGLMLEVYLATGGRRNEVCFLTWEDIDFRRGQVRFKNTKSRKERVAKLGPSLLERLSKRRCTGRIWNYSKCTVARHFKRCARMAGLTEPEKLKIHTLRHTVASHLAERGISLKAISELLGHSSITITEKYSHLSPECKADAMKVLPWVK